MDDPNSEEGYEVGYGKPPVHTQFRTGQSGNPRGRPRGSKSWTTLAEEELRKTVEIVENGKLKRITRKRAVVRRAVHAALAKGDLTMLKALGVLNEPAALAGQKDEFEVFQCTLVFGGEKQLTTIGGELVQDHRAEREAARRMQSDQGKEPK